MDISFVQKILSAFNIYEQRDRITMVAVALH